MAVKELEEKEVSIGGSMIGQRIKKDGKLVGVVKEISDAIIEPQYLPRGKQTVDNVEIKRTLILDDGTTIDGVSFSVGIEYPEDVQDVETYHQQLAEAPDAQNTVLGRWAINMQQHAESFARAVEAGTAEIINLNEQEGVSPTAPIDISQLESPGCKVCWGSTECGDIWLSPSCGLLGTPDWSRSCSDWIWCDCEEHWIGKWRYGDYCDAPCPSTPDCNSGCGIC